MSDEYSPQFAKQQLEQLIAKIVNAWLYQQGHNRASYEKRVEVLKRFCNMSLQEVYEMLNAGVLVHMFTPDNGKITQDMVRRTLEANSYEEFQKNLLPNDYIGKTPISKWLKQKEDEGATMSRRLLAVIGQNIHKWEYIEHISKFSFMQCRNTGEGTWKEFVALRGY